MTTTDRSGGIYPPFSSTIRLIINYTYYTIQLQTTLPNYKELHLLHQTTPYPTFTKLHYTTSHQTTLHDTTPNYNDYTYFTKLQHITPNYTPFTKLHQTAPYYFTPNYFRAFQTSRVLQISMNAPCRMK